MQYLALKDLTFAGIKGKKAEAEKLEQSRQKKQK
jgi:hypothetical protein